jgi:hypothetical protein
LERRAGGRRRSRSTMRSGGAQTRSREASMETRKKAVLAHRRAHRASPPCASASCRGSFFSIEARSNPESRRVLAGAR